MNTNTIQWLLNCAEPWTRYRTMVDLLDLPADDPTVLAARTEMLTSPQVQALMAAAATWGDTALKRHNDASHPIYAFSTLADFGVQADDPSMATSIDAVLAHQSDEGAFQTALNIHPRYGGTGEDTWSWMLCDAPTLLYTLLAMGLSEEGGVLSSSKGRVQRAVEHLVGLIDENGWRCGCAPEFGKFRGPGRKADPCPIVNVYSLKALSLIPDHRDSPATRVGTEMLLWHWQHQTERKIYMFGIGTTFRRLKYPFVWYDILHVVDVLSRFPFVHADPRFRQMVETITTQADRQGRYTAGSMFMAWKGWSFANKKQPSPWLTFLVLRIQKRIT